MPSLCRIAYNIVRRIDPASTHSNLGPWCTIFHQVVLKLASCSGFSLCILLCDGVVVVKFGQSLATMLNHRSWQSGGAQTAPDLPHRFVEQATESQPVSATAWLLGRQRPLKPIRVSYQPHHNTFIAQTRSHQANSILSLDAFNSPQTDISVRITPTPTSSQTFLSWYISRSPHSTSGADRGIDTLGAPTPRSWDVNIADSLHLSRSVTPDPLQQYTQCRSNSRRML